MERRLSKNYRMLAVKIPEYTTKEVLKCTVQQFGWRQPIKSNRKERWILWFDHQQCYSSYKRQQIWPNWYHEFQGFFGKLFILTMTETQWSDCKSLIKEKFIRPLPLEILTMNGSDTRRLEKAKNKTAKSVFWNLQNFSFNNILRALFTRLFCNVSICGKSK